MNVGSPKAQKYQTVLLIAHRECGSAIGLAWRHLGGGLQIASLQGNIQFALPKYGAACKPLVGIARGCGVLAEFQWSIEPGDLDGYACCVGCLGRRCAVAPSAIQRNIEGLFVGCGAHGRGRRKEHIPQRKIYGGGGYAAGGHLRDDLYWCDCLKIDQELAGIAAGTVLQY